MFGEMQVLICILLCTMSSTHTTLLENRLIPEWLVGVSMQISSFIQTKHEVGPFSSVCLLHVGVML